MSWNDGNYATKEFGVMQTHAVVEALNGKNPPLQPLLTAYKFTGLSQQSSNCLKFRHMVFHSYSH
jgi:hypothetical protein